MRAVRTLNNDKRGAKPITAADITRLLSAWSQGDRTALEQVTRLVYEELRQLAHKYMAGQRPDHTLQTTALVNEAYLRLAGQDGPGIREPFAFPGGGRDRDAPGPRRLREVGAPPEARCGCAMAVTLDEGAVLSPEPTQEILDLNEALEKLAALDPRKARVVELQYFGGLNQDEIAEILNVSAVTVRRDWTFSRAWLYAELRGAE